MQQGMETKELCRLRRMVSERLEARVIETCGTAKDKKKLCKLGSETDCEQRKGQDHCWQKMVHC